MLSLSRLKLATLAVVACVGTLQTGCTDREVAAGVVGGVIGAILVDSANQPPPLRHPSRTCRVERIERCGWVSDYYGYRRHQCVYTDYDSCAGRYRKMSLTGSQTDVLDVGTLASTYKLSEKGAAKFIQALKLAHEAKTDEEAKEAFATISIDLAEVKSLGQDGDPSVAMIDRLAKALDQKTEDTAAMIASITATARAQAAARNQPDSI